MRFGGSGFRDLIRISRNEAAPVGVPLWKAVAPGSKAKRPMFSALVNARIAEYGPGMPGWEDRVRGYLNKK
jgi:hypothetical protein